MSDETANPFARFYQLQAEIASGKAKLAEIDERYAQEAAPVRDAVQALELQLAQARQAIRDELLVMKKDHGIRSFGGATLRQARKITVVDRAAALEALRGVRVPYGKKIIDAVKETIDGNALKALAISYNSEIPGVRVDDEWEVAMASDSDLPAAA